jgi:MscS family membrane protein
MEDIIDFLSIEILENTLIHYFAFALILLSGIIFKRLLSKITSKLLFRMFKRYSEEVSWDKLFELIRKPFGFLIVMIFAYIAFTQLSFPETWHLLPKTSFGIKMIIERLYLVVFGCIIIWIFLRMVDFIGIILIRKAEKTETKSDDQMVPFLVEVLKVIVTILGIFIILGSVFKLNIGSLIAGLGIGGLAIALAAKESLENLIGSFTIFLDKPFSVGDLITIGGMTGVVEKIGFRSTRIRTLDKTFVTVPNKKLVDDNLDNLSLRSTIRAKFDLIVSFDTSPEKVQNVISDIQKLIDNHNLTSIDGIVKFTEFGSYGLKIMIMYFVDTNDWNVYINTREELNYKIIDILFKNKVRLAYPTTAVVSN